MVTGAPDINRKRLTPVAVMLDFVNPQRAGRWPGDFGRLAGFDEAGGTPPHGHAGE
jgi:hypothetical protein